MSATATITGTYLAAFEADKRGDFSSQPEEVRRLRQEAMERFRDLGFPTTRQEDWRHTSVEPVSKQDFLPLVETKWEAVRSPIDHATLPDSLRVVVANGKFIPELSSLDGVPDGVVVKGLAQALFEDREAVLAHLGHYADYTEQPFAALNTAFLTDGVFIRVPRGVVLDRPVQVMVYSNTGQVATRVHPRALILAEENSQLEVIEHFLGAARAALFMNPVTEMVASSGAVVNYTRIQDEPTKALHVAAVQVHQEASSRVALHTFTVGGGLVRNDIRANLAGEGAEIVMNGLYLVRGRQQVDNHTWIEHVAPHCTSSESYKGILDEQGRAVFNGRVVVQRDAQKTDAAQSNKNLMLSDKALVNTNPQLEIYADDVKCTHGSTVGQIDEEAYFYFLSRGIDRPTAQYLMIHGFAREIIDRVEHGIVRQRVQELVAHWLSNGQEHR
jgi:Fe-S cluster assembly protein SufD